MTINQSTQEPAKIQKCLLDICHVVKMHEELWRVTGNNFNIFSILDLDVNEARTHSALIGELLDTKGSHGQGDIYLELFLKQLDGISFKGAGSRAYTEVFIGEISVDGDRGGRLDILVEDSEKAKRIIIENKIYAVDQEKQLLRYHNYDPTATLVYLTLEGNKPSLISSDRVSIDNIICLSYREHIVSWLSDCIKESAGLPYIRETLIQYSNLIKRLTGQGVISKMNNEIIEILKSNKDCVDSLCAMSDALRDAVNNVRSQVFKELTEQFEKVQVKLCGNDLLEIALGEDGDGFFIGYRVKGRKKQSDNEHWDTYVKAAPKDNVPKLYNNSQNWFIWWNPVPFKLYTKFNFDSICAKQRELLQEIIGIHGSVDDIKKFTVSIAEEEKLIRENFLKNLKKTCPEPGEVITTPEGS